MGDLFGGLRLEWLSLGGLGAGQSARLTTRCITLYYFFYI